MSSHSQNRFATTRWSVVMHTAGTSTAQAHDALAELVQRYWYPVYAYARRCGHPAPISEDIARTFLGLLMEDFRSHDAGQMRGQFRRFLFDRLNAFLASDWRNMTEASSDLVAPLDLETCYQRDRDVMASPEEAYQRAFALEVIARALKRLASEASRAGHQAMYAALKPYLAHDPAPGEYEALAQRIAMRPLGLIVALKRLRQRLRELAAEELADTVTSDDELASEQSALHSILRSDRMPK